MNYIVLTHYEWRRERWGTWKSENEERDKDYQELQELSSNTTIPTLNNDISSSTNSLYYLKQKALNDATIFLTKGQNPHPTHMNESCTPKTIGKVWRHFENKDKASTL